MGNKQTAFTEEDLEDYEDLTHLTRKEILLAWRKWKELVGGEVGVQDKTSRHPEAKIQELPELKYNPFRDRVTRVFSSLQDSRMSFEDFLDLLSVMSNKAPLQLKAHYAFHIFDYNEDRNLDAEDLHVVVEKLTGSQGLLPEEKERLVKQLPPSPGGGGGGWPEELLRLRPLQRPVSSSCVPGLLSRALTDTRGTEPQALGQPHKFFFFVA